MRSVLRLPPLVEEERGRRGQVGGRTKEEDLASVPELVDILATLSPGSCERLAEPLGELAICD